jgi:hypothetical protein
MMGPFRQELQKTIQQEYEGKLEAEKVKLQLEAKQHAERITAEHAKELEEQVKELTGQLKEAQKNELALRKARKDLETKQEQFELLLSRKVDEEVGKAKEELGKNYALKMAEQDKQAADLRGQIEELKRKAEQGSQQAHGEILELRLEDLLQQSFPEDLVEPVPKGTKGADVIQRVNGKHGDCCGTIIWESKNTKNWSKSWIDKLKENQRDVKAEIAVLASAVLPEGIQSFGELDGIWITHWSYACQLACALRFNLIQVNRASIAREGKDQKMGMLYDYFTGPLFKQRVETIAGAFKRMREDLDQEKDAMERIWNKREKQIVAVMKGTAGMYGDIEGIAGAYLPQIEILQLPDR